LTLANSSTYGGANLTTLTNTGVSLIVDGSQVTGAIACRLNGNSASTFTINAGQVFGWGRGDILVRSVDFANSSGGSQVVQLIVGFADIAIS
jgi:hypothetical protein